ncbi:fumarate hydratase [Eggerthella sp. YY7918]|uniref:fumarate hydratase n=1 Tax=Eggerthella sp. (strain YY7918) TaxID=502558 RepID=UPI00021713C5|nr:fumarate hydratase [Eggerthella sp. YY7918]BAK44265.1 tartrate dehydratase alpha subunit [Eggerthella sp. YY7918]
MKTVITKTQVANAVYAALPQLACVLPDDIEAGLAAALEREESPRGCAVLNQLVKNARIAREDFVPICQDTGTVWASLEIGPDVLVSGDVFAEVNDAVARAYEEARLRMSVVCDAVLDRANTGDNTPAFCDIHLVDEPGVARLHLMLKGGGSDNASRVVMLAPGAGKQGIVDELVRCVREKGANACPPLVVGVGIGGTFDKVAGLAKRALMRPVDEPADDARVAALEEELLAAVNATGVGPGGLGGRTTALAVRVATAPCHIAALPLAINMGCSAMRRVTIDLADCHPERAKRVEGSRAAVAESASGLSACTGSFDSGAFGTSVQDDKRADAFAAGRDDGVAVGAEPVHLSLPLDRAQLAGLKAGDSCLLTGPLYTLRDAGHVRLMGELEQNGGVLPYNLAGQTIFYAGPTPAAAGRPFGAVGPTTAGRMDFAASELYRAGVVATIGKGRRTADVRKACEETGSVYFVACGGAAAYLTRCVASSDVVAYDDLGTEALRKIEVVDFPVFVGIDVCGHDVYDLV